MSTKNNENKVISQEDIMKLLDSCYAQVLNGLGKVSPPIEVMTQDYLEKNSDPAQAAKSMIKAQVIKCTTSGFVTGFGGLLTMPITIPANIGSVLYVQMRMIACTAQLAGYDLKCDQVQTLIYACLAGVAVNEILKKTGIKLGEKLAVNLIKKIPGSVLTKINQKVGFRFLTKFGQKGLVNLGKMVPGVGAVISGGLDFVETQIIGDRAYKWFFSGDFSSEERDDETTDDNVIDVEYTVE